MLVNLRPESRQPAQSTQTRQKTVLAASGHDEPGQSMHARPKRAPGYVKRFTAVDRSGNRIFPRAAAEKVAAVHPLGLNELELSAQMSSDEREHQTTIHAVIFQDAIRKWSAVGSPA